MRARVSCPASELVVLSLSIRVIHIAAGSHILLKKSLTVIEHDPATML
jgi:hypothetical protein